MPVQYVDAEEQQWAGQILDHDAATDTYSLHVISWGASMLVDNVPERRENAAPPYVRRMSDVLSE